jgi:DNA polymerase III delta prime subunit
VVATSKLPLAERRRPTRLDDVIGNAPARAELRAWAERWNAGTPPAHRAALLSGPAGVGKTSAALALAADLGWSVVEMNASDARNEAAIDQVAGRASVSHTLMEGTPGRGRRRALIVMDEADSLSGRATESARAPCAPPSLKEYLRGRYREVESLNRAWGLVPDAKPPPFESWDDVPRSPGNRTWGRLPSARRDLEDWRSTGKARDTSDRGGLGAMARLVRSTRQPLVLIVNDDRVLTRYAPVFRTGVARIRFFALRERELVDHLGTIARAEKIALAPGALEAIAGRSRGDLRAAMNDLEAVAPIPPGPLQLEVLGMRDLTSDFAHVTEEVLSSARFYRSAEVRDRLDAPPDDLFPWIEENLPHFAPDAAHRAIAFEHLAAAEKFLAWARRYRVWGLWSYASEVMTGGVGLALREQPTASSGKAYFPRFLGEMGRSRAVRGVREAVVRRLGTRFHLSHDKARESLLPFLESLFEGLRDRKRGPALRRVVAAIVRELGLTAEEAGYLAHAEPGSALIADLLGEATPVEDEADESGPVEAPPAPTGRTPVDPERRKVQRHLSDFGGR